MGRKYPRFKISCGCGCGELIDNRDRWGTLHYYKNGHPNKGKTLTPTDRHCSKCGSYKTNTRLHKNGYLNSKWRNHNGEWYCNKCYSKYIENPKLHPIYGPKRIVFKERRVQLKENPRTGQCKKCHKKIGDEYINSKGEVKIIDRTQMHHIEYHEDDPLKDTVELCMPCHMKLGSM